MLKQLWHAIQSGLSFRHKLLALVVVPLILLTCTVIYFIASWSTHYTHQHLVSKVNADLHIASNEFQRIQERKQSQLKLLAAGVRFVDALKSDDAADLSDQLKQLCSEGDFDFLNLLDPTGTKRMTSAGWVPWEMPSSALTEKILDTSLHSAPSNAMSGIEIYSRDTWSLQERVSSDDVVFPLIETPHSSPTTRVTEDRAMIIRVLQRVVDVNNHTIALLEGGVLLNRNFKIVDEIRDLVYVEGSLLEGSWGAVTVFLDDVRISTNVPSIDKTRALGTRVSAEVRESVLEQGQTWIGSAFVVNDWYVSAYEPILDVAGKKVGMLYAGYLQDPYRLTLLKGIALISAMLIGGSLLAIAAAVHGAQSMFKPVEAIARVIRATALGERRRIGKIDSADEIGELAGQFDYMLDTLEQNQSRIENDAMQLEEKVRSRTVELEQQNHRLQETLLLVHETRQRLAMAEKLAALGQLTAGVAHEINNPTAVILGNMDILIEEIGEARSGVEVEIDLIIAQVYRIRSITDRLLQYSRPGSDSSQLEYLGQAGFEAADPQVSTNEARSLDLLDADLPSLSKALLDINQAIQDSLLLVSHELDSKSIVLELSLGEINDVAVGLQEFQQVLVNLLTNAIDAVEEQGHIWVSTGCDESFVWFEVKDDGVGIAEEDLQRVFDPFFTRDKEGGTGLGLSVSYGIVSRYQGQIEVESPQRNGTVFTVIFPAVELPNETEKSVSADLAPA